MSTVEKKFFFTTKIKHIKQLSQGNKANKY